MLLWCVGFAVAIINTTKRTGVFVVVVFIVSFGHISVHEE